MKSFGGSESVVMLIFIGHAQYQLLKTKYLGF